MYVQIEYMDLERYGLYLNPHLFVDISKRYAVLSSATERVMPPEFSLKWRTEVSQH